MKQFFKAICVLTILAGLVFSANSRILKSEIKKNRPKKVEPDYRRGQGATRAEDCPIMCPGNITIDPSAGEVDCPSFSGDSFETLVAVIDSSANGFGMVSTVTRPFDVNADGNMVVVYRQYAGELTTHGQLGAGYGAVTEGAIQWDVQYNVNFNGNPPWGGGGVGSGYDENGEWIGASQARYPSSLATEEYPYAIWNEYTGGPPTEFPWPSECSSYGGRPYFSYDEFGWGGESWLFPAELDPLYACEKDLWLGSVGYGYDEPADEHHISVVYDDWTRTGSFLFTSEAVEDGYIILGTETLIVNPDNLGTDGYSSAAILSMNDNGQGLLGIDGIFEGVDMDTPDPQSDCGNPTCIPPASNLTCNKVPMFKLTENYGQSWAGNHAAFDFHYVPDEVFDDIFANWPAVDVDPYTGTEYDICSYWSWYEFDMRVDQSGNPHIVISLIAESESYVHFLDGYTGFYHLTIDKDNLSNLGPVNECIANDDGTCPYDGTDTDGDGLCGGSPEEESCTATGWTWSYVPLPANDSFNWTNPHGDSFSGYLYHTVAQISLSRDNPDIVYIVGNIAEQGAMAAEYDTNGDGECDLDLLAACDAIEETRPWDLYPNWSEDIWVVKSENDGSTWSGKANLTQTPRNPDPSFHPDEYNCYPEEQYVHTAHWSDDERVYFQYQQPNWGFNEIGDQSGADHMNRVFLGYAWVESGLVGGCTDQTNCSYDEDAQFDDDSCGTGIYPCGTDPETYGCGCDLACGDTLEPPAVVGCDGACGSGAFNVCNPVSDGGGEECVPAGTEVCSQGMWDDDLCDIPNEWYDCDNLHCGPNDPLYYENELNPGSASCADEGYVACDGGRCYTCSDGESTNYADCAGGGGSAIWDVETVDDCLDFMPDCEDVVTAEENCLIGTWIPFAYTGQVTGYDECVADEACEDNPDGDGADPNECYCSNDGAEYNCEIECTVGDINGDDTYNVLDIVGLANCVLAGNCADAEDAGCAADVNGDGNYNVLDIVSLANCVLAGNCGARIDDATQSKLIMKDNMVSIEADGFIGGVQMTLQHGADFSIEMTDRALLADYLTDGNETRLLVITPETDELFGYSGDFEITEVIVANSHAEVSTSLPMANSFSLSAAYPNPFNPTTTMELTMPVNGDIRVVVYNLLGQSVSTLTDGYKDAGTYSLTWDATNVASGVYFIKAQADGFTKIQKLMLIK